MGENEHGIIYSMNIKIAHITWICTEFLCKKMQIRQYFIYKFHFEQQLTVQINEHNLKRGNTLLITGHLAQFRISTPKSPLCCETCVLCLVPYVPYRNSCPRPVLFIKMKTEVLSVFTLAEKGKWPRKGKMSSGNSQQELGITVDSSLCIT